VQGVEGAPRLPDGTIAGSVLTMDAAVRNMVSSGASDLASALRAASAVPADLLGLDDRGTITVGARADLVALRPDLTVEQVWIGGVAV
jgi:N-acetylglucosamine-6-phosphate deacetylase